MDAETADFARFYAESRDDCLRTVLASVGDLDRAKELVDEAFARAWASWRKVGRHPAPRAWIVRTALNAGVSAWRRRRREVPLGAAWNCGLGGACGGCPNGSGRSSRCGCSSTWTPRARLRCSA